MNIILIFFLAFLLIWALGVLVAGYHVFSFRYPKDQTAAFFTSFLIISVLLLLVLTNWFLSAYFSGA